MKTLFASCGVTRTHCSMWPSDLTASARRRPREARRVIHAVVEAEVQGWPVPLDELTDQESERLAVLLALATVQRFELLPAPVAQAICMVIARSEALCCKLLDEALIQANACDAG